MEFNPRTLGNFRQKKESDNYLYCDTTNEKRSKEFFEKTEKQLLKEFKANAKRMNLLPKLKGKNGHEELMKARREWIRKID
jgi:glycerophosphoryl diester phosphodiesterase